MILPTFRYTFGTALHPFGTPCSTISYPNPFPTIRYTFPKMSTRKDTLPNAFYSFAAFLFLAPCSLLRADEEGGNA